MKTLKAFVKDYLMVPIGMPIFTVLMVYACDQREADAYAYSMTAETWPQLSEQTHNAVRDAMEGGYMTRWQYQSISKMATDEQKVLSFTLPAKTKTVEQARATLVEVMRNEQ